MQEVTPVGTDFDSSRRRRGGWVAGLMAAALLVAASCGSSASSNASGNGLSGTVVVLAAASLTSAFDRIGKEFHEANPSVQVKFSYAGSSSLVTQIQQGAPADVFASADTTNMDKVTSDGLAEGSPSTFARNQLEIATEKGNPKNIKTVQDLANPSLKVVVCAPSVPCGAYSTEVFQKAGITVNPVSEETSVSGVVTKVSLGEADAGVVYITDVKASGDKLTGVPIPPELNVIATYPIVELKNAPNHKAAQAFINFVLGQSGQKALQDFGFLPPE